MDAHPTPGYRTGTAAPEWLRVEATATGVIPGPRLLLAYTVTNRGPAPVLLADVWPAGWRDGRFETDPLGCMVSLAPGPVVVVERGAPSRGEDVSVESPWCPLARRLAVGAWVSGSIALPLPARPHDPYHRPGGAPGPGTAVPTVRLTLGWLPDDGQSPQLLPEVATSEGPLVHVKVAPGTLVRSSAEISFTVPAVLPIAARTWSCQRCGATNTGDQRSCLRCGQDASAPAPRAAWRATHAVPPAGATWYSEADRSPGGSLAPGLPVALVERAGDWGRVMAENGWTGWVDARLLRPL